MRAEQRIGGEDVCVSVVADIRPVEDVGVVADLGCGALGVVPLDHAGNGGFVALAEDGGGSEGTCEHRCLAVGGENECLGFCLEGDERMRLVMLGRGVTLVRK